MTAWSTPALLLLGIASGPYGLDLLSPSVVELLDPAIGMAVAMLGVFVGLSSSRSTNFGNVLLIGVGGLILGAFREPAAGPLLLLTLAFAAVAIMTAVAGWLLVGQTDSEGEQHVFVVGSLLLIGGAATYLSLSAVLGGLLTGLTWSVAGNLAKVRIVRDLHYFQHPLVVLVLITAGAGAALSSDAAALAAVVVIVRAISRPLGAWTARQLAAMSRGDDGASLVSVGLVGLALALDVVRADGRPDWAVTLLGAVVIATVASDAVALFLPVRGERR